MTIPDDLDTAVARRLTLDWALDGATVESHDLGMNSRTWIVTAGASRWVAKAVPVAKQPRFTAALRVAALVEAAGIPAGAPMPTRGGALVTRIGHRELALLTYVPGRPLDGETEDDRRLIGRVLGRTHRALAGLVLPDAERFHWVDPNAGHLDIRSWLRTAVADAVGAYEALGPATLTSGLLHTDPAPEAFRFDRTTGRCGLIDWDHALVGPLLYDLASAVLYVGGPERGAPLVEAYLDEGAMDRAEAERGLLPMLRFRWGVQADYFARRVATNDLTGIDGPEDNEKGLEDARLALGDLSGS